MSRYARDLGTGFRETPEKVKMTLFREPPETAVSGEGPKDPKKGLFGGLRHGDRHFP